MTNEDLAILIQQGQTELYNELWEQNVKLFTKKAYCLYRSHGESCARSGVELDDILQCCFLSLVEAVRAFNKESGYKLTTYINYPLTKHFRELLGIRTTKRDPLNLCKSLDEPISEEEEINLSDLIPDSNAIKELEAVEDSAFNEELHNALEMAMQNFEEEQRDIIRRKYYKSQSVEKIAEETNLTLKEVVSLEHKAMKDFRKPQNRKHIDRYASELLDVFAYRGTGLSVFEYTGCSSVERAVINLEYAGIK